MHWKRKPRRSLFLLTPLREGRPLTLYFVSSTLNISTHAPAGGATKLDAETNTLSVISTHAPAGGATLRRYPAACRTSHFYSRPCGRGDLNLLSAKMFNPLISTHAPAGGATLPPSSGRTQPRISTHAPAGGATRPSCLLVKRSGNFYSRPCGRGDRRHSFGVSAPRSFLLTPLREGRRFQRDGGAGVYVISTHAPAGGATFAWSRLVATA